MLLTKQETSAQVPIADIIKAAVTKVIKAVDLKIQRLQNKTIWLQNAQKALENKMQELKLGEISSWLEAQRKLYADYYEELWKVKSAINYYHKVKDIIAKQIQLVDAYKRALALFKQDAHFSDDEMEYMKNIFSGILDESVKNLDALYLVINPLITQMSDAKRLERIDEADEKSDEHLTDIRQFINENIGLSLQRAKDHWELNAIKKFYGIQ